MNFVEKFVIGVTCLAALYGKNTTKPETPISFSTNSFLVTFDPLYCVPAGEHVPCVEVGNFAGHSLILYHFTDAQWNIITNIHTNTFYIDKLSVCGTNQWAKEHGVKQ